MFFFDKFIYKYFKVDKKGKIQIYLGREKGKVQTKIQIFELVFTNKKNI